MVLRSRDLSWQFLSQTLIITDYCDYCERSFPDNPEARKKHLEGAQHQLSVKRHYDAYKGVFTDYWVWVRILIRGVINVRMLAALCLDPVELLLENARKPPCRRFLETGFCPFGLSCRYSHVPPHIDMSTIDPHCE